MNYKDNPIVDLTIYHIPGTKVGCTENFSKRSWSNKNNLGKDTKIEVLCSGPMTIEAASDLEFMFADEFGYKRYARYATVYRNSKDQERSLKISAAKDGHQVTQETKKAISKGQIQRYKDPKENLKLSQAAKKRGRIQIRAVMINGVKYDTAVIASEKTKMNKSTLTYRCRSANYPDFYYV